MALMTGFEFVAEGGRIQLPLTGCMVNRCCVDWAISLEMQKPDGDHFELRIGGVFAFTAPGGNETLMRPEEDPVGLGPVLACTRTAVESATAVDDGRLEMSFSDGSSLCVTPSPAYEAWELTGPRGSKIVCMPGGELAIWQPTSDDSALKGE
jgi:hypothetical protein